MTAKEMSEKILEMLSINPQRTSYEQRVEKIESLLTSALEEAKADRDRWADSAVRLEKAMEAYKDWIKPSEHDYKIAQARAEGYEEGSKAALSKEITTGMALMAEVSEAMRKAKAKEAINQIKQEAYEHCAKIADARKSDVMAKTRADYWTCADNIATQIRQAAKDLTNK